MTEEEIESVVQDMEQCSEDDIKKIVKFAQDFKKKPRFHYRNPPTPDHYYHCEICHNPMPELPKSTIIISYQCTDPKVSIGDLKFGAIMQKNITSLYSSLNHGKHSTLSRRDSLRQSRLSFLSFQSLPQVNQNLGIEKIDEEF